MKIFIVRLVEMRRPVQAQPGRREGGDCCYSSPRLPLTRGRPVQNPNRRAVHLKEQFQEEGLCRSTMEYRRLNLKSRVSAICSLALALITNVMAARSSPCRTPLRCWARCSAIHGREPQLVAPEPQLVAPEPQFIAPQSQLVAPKPQQIVRRTAVESLISMPE